MEDDDIIQLKTHPGARGEKPAAPVTTAENKEHLSPSETTSRRGKLTKAERHYRRSVFSAVITLIFVLFLILFIIIGGASMYAIKALSVEPRKSYIIYDTANKLRTSGDIKNKIDIICDGIKKFNGDIELFFAEKSAEKKSGGGKLRAIRERKKINEEAANSGVVK